MPFRDEHGRIVLWFGTNTDVSEQKRIVQERDELLASERAARSAAEHASQMKNEFLATLSHDFDHRGFNARHHLKQLSREPRRIEILGQKMIAHFWSKVA